MSEDIEASSLDEGLEKLVIALNRIKGIKTIKSHKGGANEHLSWVSFETRSFRSLGRLVRKITVGREGYKFHTKIIKDTGEVEFGFWVEADYDNDLNWPVFFLKVLAPDGKTRLAWINSLLRYLSFGTRR